MSTNSQAILMFNSALESGDIEQAIRLISSVEELQTEPNMLLCCRDSNSAFDLLRLIPKARQIKTIVELATSETRVARLVAEDLPELVNDEILHSAINGEEAWADRYLRRRFC